MRRRGKVVAAALVILSTSACGSGESSSPDGGRVLVAAASNLRFAFEAAADEFERATGTEVVLTFGSSGNLAEQIQQGAPYDVYAPASVEFLDRVITTGRTDEASRSSYAVGRLAVRVRDGVRLPSRLEDLAGPTFTRVAIANPTHAPYGVAAREALESLGMWDEIEPRVVFGENVTDTWRLVDTGNVDAAIVALSLVIADVDPYLEIDDALHGRLEHVAIVTTTGANPAGGSRFIEFLGDARARVVFDRFGYGKPVGAG